MQQGRSCWGFSISREPQVVYIQTVGPVRIKPGLSIFANVPQHRFGSLIGNFGGDMPRPMSMPGQTYFQLALTLGPKEVSFSCYFDPIPETGKILGAIGFKQNSCTNKGMFNRVVNGKNYTVQGQSPSVPDPQSLLDVTIMAYPHFGIELDFGFSFTVSNNNNLRTQIGVKISYGKGMGNTGGLVFGLIVRNFRFEALDPSLKWLNIIKIPFITLVYSSQRRPYVMFNGLHPPMVVWNIVPGITLEAMVQLSNVGKQMNLLKNSFHNESTGMPITLLARLMWDKETSALTVQIILMGIFPLNDWYRSPALYKCHSPALYNKSLQSSDGRKHVRLFELRTRH